MFDGPAETTSAAVPTFITGPAVVYENKLDELFVENTSAPPEDTEKSPAGPLILNRVRRVGSSIILGVEALT